MASRRPEGAALLVAGHGAIGTTTLDASMVHTLGQIGESLLATAVPWDLRRLSGATGERYGADRGSLKQHLDEMAAEPVRVLVLVVLGIVVELPGGPALVTGTQVRDYPEDATLPLAWIGERLRGAKAERLLVVWSAQPAVAGAEVPLRGWLDALGTGRPHDVVAVDSPRAGCPLADALLGGLCGDALDPKTGTVTMRSISDHLVGRVPNAAVQMSAASATIAESPPLAGLWDVRRSQLATHGMRPLSPTSEDLTGTVLPGRFRIDAMVARGTFGTVYRARQLAVERDVAVKVLHGDIDPASEDGRLFVHEIRSVGRIDHANVVRIHQADITHDGRLFFAMELLDGRDLQQMIAEEPLAKAVAVELVRQLLAGLGAAHAAGLVHADVKPANALVVKRDGVDRVVLVDFGLARLRAPDRPALSAGGTPAYMAPEQLHEGRVDARSDLFSAALVLVALLTRWRRPNAHTLVPSMTIIEDPALRIVIERALALDPAKRYQSARELGEALTGIRVAQAPTVTQPTPFLPFHHLAALTERDRGRLHGREADVALLTEHVLYRRSVVYTAPSGTGKTSLLRAGLLPRLETLGIRAVYLRCRADAADKIATAIWPGATSIADAIAQDHQQRGNKLVLVLDQLEALGDGEQTLIRDVLAFERWPGADVAVVLSVREDHLARLVARTQPEEPGMAIVRLPPLRPEGARAAITGPLIEARLAIEPDLLDALLEDLQRAAAAIGAEMGWGGAPAVFPPHLQLACSVLYEALGPGEATLTLAHYRRLGGFDAIVGEHLERVVESELADGRDVIARDLFVALVTTAHERAMRPESELLEIVGAQHGAKRVMEVLELLRTRGLLVRVRVDADDPSWELVHDSLVPRVLAWVDRRDLARRRAVELVRYHLRRSQPEAPSLLGRMELREVRAHDAAITELDAEMKQRGGNEPWTPRRLVDQSLRSLRRRTAAIATVITTAAAIAGVSLYTTAAASARARHEQSLRDRDLGRFVLSLEPFDLDPTSQLATPVTIARLPALSWQLRTSVGPDLGAPGTKFQDGYVERGDPELAGLARVEHVEAHGGPAFLVVEQRGGTCAPSIVPLKIPGYASRSQPEPTLHIRVPTCAASRIDMLPIPAGPFIYGGPGEPPSEMAAKTPEWAIEKELPLPAFTIDRTERTNAQFELFAGVTGIPRPEYPSTPDMAGANDPDKPVVGVTWYEARAYCAFFGKNLPTSQQWQKALRGGLQLGDGSPNPMPRRTFPWGDASLAAPANIGPGAHTAVVGTFPLDRSPYGVLDLAGNAMEWTSTQYEPGFFIIRGASYETTPQLFRDFMAIENRRATTTRDYSIGVRCVE